MRRWLEAAFWIAAYLVLVLAPIFLILTHPPGRSPSFWTSFSVALGFAAIGMMGMQFVLTARFRRAAAPFGTDILYHFHRYLGLLVLGVLGAHAVIFVVEDPALLQGLAPATPSRPLILGTLAFVAAAAVVATSIWRQPLGLPYERWRVLHAVLAVLAVAGGIWHALDYGTHSSPARVRMFWMAYGTVALAIIAYVRALKPWRTRVRPWSVVARRDEPGGMATLAFEPRGHEGMSFRAGQFAWLTLDASPFAMAEHPFSFSSAPGLAPRVEITIQPIGDFTRAAVGAAIGTTAFLEGPHGIFTVEDHPAERYVFFAGGIGIAPLISILRDRADRADARPFLLFYATRTVEGTAFRDELATLSGRMRLDLVYVVEEPGEEWAGEEGRIDAALLERYLPEDRRTPRYFMCGPRGMQSSLERLLEGAGVPSNRIHAEVFHWV